MRTLDPRIRELHIARYGVEATERYLSVIANIPALPDDKRGANHHLLARSIWPEYKNLRQNPWNRLRVSHKVHAALTELQGDFEARFRSAALRMKGQSLEAHLAACRLGGKIGGAIQGRKNVESGQLASVSHLGGSRTYELYPDIMRENGKIQGKKNAESGHMTRIAGMGRKRAHELHPNLAKISNHIRWHVNRTGGFNPQCSLCLQII